MKKFKMSESQLVNLILEGLAFRNIFAWRSNNTPIFDAGKKCFRKQHRYAAKGLADICLVFPNGIAGFIECKVGSNKQTQDQRDFEAKVKKNNGIYILAYKWEDVEKYINIAR